MSKHQRETIDQMLRDAPFDLGGDVLGPEPRTTSTPDRAESGAPLPRRSCLRRAQDGTICRGTQPASIRSAPRPAASRAPGSCTNTTRPPSRAADRGITHLACRVDYRGTISVRVTSGGSLGRCGFR